MSMVAMLELVCLYLCICACLDCEEELKTVVTVVSLLVATKATDTHASTHFYYMH
jgi:hypothetical protein